MENTPATMTSSLRWKLSVAVALLTLLAPLTLAQIGGGGGGSTPILSTPQGLLRGRTNTYNGNPYEEYLGIPFAAPPLGPLRWEKPAPIAPWGDEMFNATSFSPSCVHLVAAIYPLGGFGGQTSEDCLYLNVWVPNGVAANEECQLPVMVWIYGGGFQLGTGEMYPGHALALHGDVIVVNMNYRLGILGFLSTGDKEAPGNYGLWDMQAALLWVQANIASFNGDPDRVTIFGQSAGGVAVTHLMLSPFSQTLFHNAIAVSGGASASWGVQTRTLGSAIAVSEMFNCSARNTRDIVTCLRDVDGHELDMVATTGGGGGFGPVVDGDFVPRPPVESFNMGEGKNINFITGSCIHDSAGFILGNPIAFPPLLDRINIAGTNESLYENLRRSYSWAENVDDLINEVVRMYPDLNSDDVLTRTLAYTKASTEETFGEPGNWEAGRHAAAGGFGKSFVYQFHHRQSFLVGYPDWVSGSHLDDVYSILGDPFMQFYRRVYLRHNYDDVDRAVSNTIMDYYANFAHTGDPNEGPFTPSLVWPEFSDAQEFLVQAEHFRIASFYEDNIVDLYRFWREDFRRMAVPLPPPTFPSAPDDHQKLTKEDVQDMIAKFKITARKYIRHPKAWALIEQRIDQLAAQRRRNVDSDN